METKQDFDEDGSDEDFDPENSDGASDNNDNNDNENEIDDEDEVIDEEAWDDEENVRIVRKIVKKGKNRPRIAEEDDEEHYNQEVGLGDQEMV